MKKAETIKLQPKCCSMTLFPHKVPVAVGPSRPGRGELGSLTLLQVALHSLATLPTVAPSAGSATHPVVGSWWWTEHTAVISREGCRGDQHGKQRLESKPRGKAGFDTCLTAPGYILCCTKG